MNAKKLIVAMAVLATTGSVFAGDINPFPNQEQVVSEKTRAEVQSELAQARVQGWIVGGEETNYPEIPTKSTRSRAEVLAELEQSRKQGWIVGGEEANYPKIQVKSTRSRAEVRAEAIESTKNRQRNPDYDIGG
ncbi:MAG: hypothetical protein A3K04_02300 [Gallionellales bacterium RBG_16_56_9]|nr:MAG: hypothetical protein A3K04_02300 [Gallionellales bacterium RBG_16_56_9]